MRCEWWSSLSNCGKPADYELVCSHHRVATCLDHAATLEKDMRGGGVIHFGEPLVDGHAQIVSIAVTS